MTFIGKKLPQKIKKKLFLPRCIKICILVAYKFLKKYINFEVSQCISGHVISQNTEFIRLTISQPFLKIETFDLDQKIYKIMQRTLHCSWGHWGHQVHFWSRDWY